MFIPRLRVEGPERLVHEDDPRPENKGPGDGHPLPHPAGKLVGIFFPDHGRHVQPERVRSTCGPSRDAGGGPIPWHSSPKLMLSSTVRWSKLV